MLKINSDYITENGGLLHSLRKKSNQYIKSIFKRRDCILPHTIDLKKLDRTIVHAHPHLDEYFADFIFRSTLPYHKMDINFLELSIQSKTNDSTCKMYWPNAVVMGIGGTVAGGAKPLMIFDEHVQEGKRSDASCSQLVISTLLKPNIPLSIKKMLQEVNEIDAGGGAHNQHLGNIMKVAHQVRFLLEKKDSYIDSIHDWLSPEWKKTIMDASMTAIIYCLENRFDIWGEPKEKDRLLRTSFEYYITNCGYKEDIHFKDTINRIKNTYFNQTVVFKTARLPLSKREGQLLLVGRICFALEKCWGLEISKIIMMHLWEIIYQGQASFQGTIYDINEIIKYDNKIIHSTFGTFEKQTVETKNIVSSENQNQNLWVCSVDQNPRLILGNRPIMNLINKHNNGFGIIFLSNGYQFTKALFKCKGFPDDSWKLLVDVLYSLEPDCWHIVRRDDGGYAPFVVNGNKSHQYVPQSSITLNEIINIIRTID